MVKCPECGTDVVGKFCSQCGTKLPEEDKKQDDVKDVSIDGDAVVESKDDVEPKKDASLEEDVDDKKDEVESKEDSSDVNQVSCPNCGNKVKNTVKFCDKCGNQLKKEEESKPKIITKQTNNYDPTKAAIISIIPGAGHVYIDLTRKGLTIFIIWLVGVILSLFVIGYILAIAMWIYAIYSAYTDAKALNKGKYIEDKLF